MNNNRYRKNLSDQNEWIYEKIEKLIKENPQLDIAMKSDIRKTLYRFLYIKNKVKKQ